MPKDLTRSHVQEGALITPKKDAYVSYPRIVVQPQGTYVHAWPMSLSGKLTTVYVPSEAATIFRTIEIRIRGRQNEYIRDIKVEGPTQAKVDLTAIAGACLDFKVGDEIEITSLNRSEVAQSFCAAIVLEIDVPHLAELPSKRKIRRLLFLARMRRRGLT